jgi:hypothetical protein
MEEQIMDKQFAVYVYNGNERYDWYDRSWKDAHALAMKHLYVKGDPDNGLIPDVKVEIRNHIGVVFTATNPPEQKPKEPEKPRETSQSPKKWAILTLHTLKIRHFGNDDDMQSALSVFDSRKMPVEVFKYNIGYGCYAKQRRVE